MSRPTPRGNVAGKTGQTPRVSSLTLQPGADQRREEKQVVLESEPKLVLPTKSFARVAPPKVTRSQLKAAEGKAAAESIMASLNPDQKPRYAKSFTHRSKGRLAPKPHIEVLEVEGATLLGVPGSSQIQQYCTFRDRAGHRKQIVIAMHDHKPSRQKGPTGSAEAESATMRSGGAALLRQMSTLREELAAVRLTHNCLNEFVSSAKYDL
mmetsp:Transcript_26619/g.63631  ORF Transcript_26619/g.63631 Transcript_26619/m.63631 type:complete len:209 (-) Transcript_26619:76-702(-)